MKCSNLIEVTEKLDDDFKYKVNVDVVKTFFFSFCNSYVSAMEKYMYSRKPKALEGTIVFKVFVLPVFLKDNILSFYII